MISWQPFILAVKKMQRPMRLTGACRQYSKNLITRPNQDDRGQCGDLNVSFPYPAKVMKMFEPAGRPAVIIPKACGDNRDRQGGHAGLSRVGARKPAGSLDCATGLLGSNSAAGDPMVCSIAICEIQIAKDLQIYWIPLCANPARR